METSLHRQLKAVYAQDLYPTEVPVGSFRIDVVAENELIEIQHGSLAAIRSKLHKLLKQHRVRLVKPIVRRKQLVKRKARGARVVDRRVSPKRGHVLEIFHEMVYLRRVFPHRNLVIEVPLVTIEEWRYPGHGRRRRRRARDHQVEDQKLLSVDETHRFRTAQDLARLVDVPLPAPFHTGHLAESLNIPRWFARQIAYSLRETGAISLAGKQRNTLLYLREDSVRRPPRTSPLATTRLRSSRES